MKWLKVKNKKSDDVKYYDIETVDYFEIVSAKEILSMQYMISMQYKSTDGIIIIHFKDGTTCIYGKYNLFIFE